MYFTDPYKEIQNAKHSQQNLPTSYKLFQPQILLSLRCKKRDGTVDYNCCSYQNPCGKGEGDCDFDSDCYRGLKCGHDNCWSSFGVGSWESKADCCYGIHI